MPDVYPPALVELTRAALDRMPTADLLEMVRREAARLSPADRTILREVVRNRITAEPAAAMGDDVKSFLMGAA